MWFKKSLIPILAAVVLAMESECYIAAGIFFTLGMFERSEEIIEDNRIREEEIIDESEYEKHKRQQEKKTTTEED